MIVYQWREIGETEWQDCDKKWFDYCAKSPIHDTRKFYKSESGGCVRF